MSIKSQLYKGVLEICILQLIHNGTNYGYDLVNSLNELDFDVSPGTVYPILTRLKSEGLVETEYSFEENRNPRKIYKLNKKGIERLKNSKSIWRDTINNINKVLN